MRQLLLAALVLAGLGGTARADETTLPRFLELRDGSVLKLLVVDEEWKVSVVRADGKIEATTIRLSALDRLVLMPEPVFEKKRALLDIIKQLGADKFQEREAAQERLVRMGATIRPDLEEALHVFTDLEVRSRLEQVINRFPVPAGQPMKISETFDQFISKEVLHGDAGEGGIPVKIDGQTRRLPRKEVRAVSVRAPEVRELIAGRGGPTGFRRIELTQFPPGCVEEPFDATPTGRKLTIGENIEKLFISKGFTLSTSIGTSFVSVNDFTVQGKSRGFSAATHQPLFQGEVTIRFCRPGHENIPAGVTHFGLWIAHVMPRGTSMVAFDLQGRELGSIQTTREGHEFLGVQSNVPIHRIKIVPTLNIDPDFTLDDFLYLMPRSLEGAHAEKYLVQFADGERVLCKDVTLGPDGIQLLGMPAGLPDRSRPLAEVVRLAAPDRGRMDRPPAPGVFVELRDGSVLFAAVPGKPGPPVFPRRPAVLKDKDNVVGMWSSELPRSVWPDKVTPPVAWQVDKKAWLSVAEVAFNEESAAWTQDGKRRSRGYFEMAPLLLRTPSGEPEVGSWRIRTFQGEEIVLGNRATPLVSGTLSKELEAKWGQTDLKVSVADLVAIYRVVKE